MNNSRARILRKRPTETENRLWMGLRQFGSEGFKFRRQEPIGRYVCDFVCFSKKLIVEVDGGQHAEKVAVDQQKTEWLESQGFRVLRFWNDQVLGDTQTVLEVISNALKGSDYPLFHTRKRAKTRRGVVLKHG